MNEHERIEEALRKMQPSELPVDLMAKLSAARSKVAQPGSEAGWRRVIARWFVPVAAGALAAWAVFALLEIQNPPREPAPVQFGSVATERTVPVESQDFLLAARPVGVLVAPDRRPYRIMDVEWLEYETLKAAEDGPALHTATQRRDVIPVALEVF